VHHAAVGRLPPVDTWHLFGKWGTVTGRWAMAGVAVVAAAAGVTIFLLSRRLTRGEGSPRKPVVTVIVGVLGILLLIDVVFVVEAVARVIWPNFVDTGG